SKDEYNRNKYEDVEIPDVPCFFDTIRKKVVKTDKSVDTIEQNILFTLPSTDVAEAKFVKDVKTLDDITILSGVFDIPEKKPIYGRKRLHHYELELEKVRQK
ncbi:hypothetical protein VVF85_19755, partial [Acinetobacter baumannii]|uniref:hypothetical protein n=1 Tax=Acinetobacter baumannii TaxID=470 RepID=UPI00300D895C